MQLKKLDQSFYPNHTHLSEALDNVNGAWIEGKTRGYGFVLIPINTLTFALPLRSNIRHNASFPTVGKHGEMHKGLDFSKALLIPNPSYISDELFLIPSREHTRLRSKEHYITSRFTKYVERYINAVTVNDHNILNSTAYRFTTLKHFHAELSI